MDHISREGGFLEGSAVATSPGSATRFVLAPAGPDVYSFRVIRQAPQSGRDVPIMIRTSRPLWGACLMTRKL